MRNSRGHGVLGTRSLLFVDRFDRSCEWENIFLRFDQVRMGAGGWRDEGVESWGGAVEGSELPLTVARGDGEPAANTGKAEALNAEPEEFVTDGGECIQTD